MYVICCFIHLFDLYGAPVYKRCSDSQEVNQNQTAKHEKPVSPVHSQPERDVDIYKEMQLQAIQKLEHQMKKQVSVDGAAALRSELNSGLTSSKCSALG